MPTISGAKSGITARKVTRLTRAEFRSWMKDEGVARIYNEICQLKQARDGGMMTEKEFEEKKSLLKKKLPYVTYMAEFKGNIRKNENAIPTGLFMMDYDHVGDPEEFYNTHVKGRGKEWAIALCHRTPSGEGLRLVGCIPPGMNIPRAQAWMGGLLGRMDYDKAVHDPARASFLPPESALLYYDEDLLFADDLAAELARRGISLPEARPGIPAEVTVTDAAPAAPAPASAPAAPARAYPTAFHGEPYADIARRWLTARGAAEPVEGERHTRLLHLAADLRYICENNPDWLRAVMPAYGLPEEELKGIADYACSKPLANCRPRRLEDALRPRCQDEPLPPLPAVLPPLISLLTENVPDFQKPAVAQAVFPALATLVSDVSFAYIDGRPTGVGLMNLLVGAQSIGKSGINTPIDYILARVRARDDENRRIEQQWKDEVNAKGANKDKRQRPRTCVQWLETDMTNAALVQRLKDAGGRYLYLRMDELRMLDALKGNTRTDSQFNIICLAFDEAPYGQERVGTMSVSGNPCLRLNWNASTTPRQGKLYFKHVLVNGPLTRISLCVIPDRGIGAEIPVYGTYGDDFARRLAPYLDHLEQASGGLDCPEAYDLARRLDAECREKAKRLQSLAYDSWRRRANVIAYRKACLLWLAGGQQWSPEYDDFVRWSLHYDLACKMRLFGPEVEEALRLEAAEAPVSTPSGRKRSDWLAALPAEFTYADLMALRRDDGRGEKGAKDLLSQWKSRGYIEPLTGDTYKNTLYRKCC